MRDKQGNALALFVGIVLLVLLFFPVLIQLLQTESKQAVHHQKSTVAFQLAEAALAKGVTKLGESRKNWTDAVAGAPILGYQDDREFSDVAGGSYKVILSPGSIPGTVLVVGKGKDRSSQEVRVLEAEYSGVDPDAPALIEDKGHSYGNSWMTAHWGSVKSYANSGYMAEYGYPRLYSAGNIRSRDTDPASPNTDSAHYWAYKTDMGSPPVPDLAYYKQKAQNSVVPSSSTTGEIRHPNGSPVARVPANSGYFQSIWALQAGEDMIFDKLTTLPEGMGNMYEFRSSTSVIYFEINDTNSSWVDIRRAFLDVEAVIAVGMWPGNLWNSAVPFHVYGATIPETAPYQYQGTWTKGFPTGQATWSSTFAAIYAQPNHCCYNITNLQIHGYVYASGFAHGGSRTLGVWHNSEVMGANGDSIVYFDPNVLQNVVWAKSPLYRLSWKESSRSW
jgi:hypothetical protein